jgi:hypothetical protein
MSQYPVWGLENPRQFVYICLLFDKNFGLMVIIKIIINSIKKTAHIFYCEIVL